MNRNPFFKASEIVTTDDTTFVHHFKEIFLKSSQPGEMHLGRE